jgi:NADH dehydrogenase
LARFEQEEGGATVPWVAQGAIQGGRAAAKNIVRTLKGQPRQAFRYWNKGDLAVIGRNKAVGNLPWGKWWGFPAWLLWLFIHILYLVGFRNRIIVLLEWGYAYVAQQRGVRLITGTAKGDRITQPPRRAL